MEPIQDGILAGLWLSVLVGPLVVIIVQNTLAKGIKHGFLTLLGIWISDLIYIVATYTLLSKVTAVQRSAFFTESIGLFGGIIVLIIGIGILLNKPKELDFNEQPSNSKRDVFVSIFQGFSVNTFNPFTITFWTGATSTAIAHDGWFTSEHIIFLSTILVVIICTDSLKVFFAHKIRMYVNQILINKVNKGAGFIIAICGVYLIVKYLNL